MKNYAFFVAILIYLLSAYFNIGWSHPDEHYQIIEFAEFKAGNNTSDELAWEFEARIRPAIQPALAYILIGSLRYAGIEDPYLLTFILRSITGCFALLSIFFFYKYQKILPSWAVYFSLFLWFVPFLNVRFSSEAWSGIIFLNVLTVLNLKFSRRFLVVGLLLGLCFLFRYQTAFMAIGLFLWLLIVEKLNRTSLWHVFAGGVIVIVLGILIDIWFYSRLVFTAYNYFLVNIVQGTASNFGISPWYYYMQEMLTLEYVAGGFLLMVSMLILTILRPKNVLVWIILPFLLVHFIIPHKEMRFLFPIANLIPLLLVTVLTLIHHQHISTRFLAKYILPPAAFLNLFLLDFLTFSPADDVNVRLTKYIHDNYKNKDVKLYARDMYFNPYRPLGTLKQKFYEIDNSSFTIFTTAQDLKEKIDNVGLNFIILKRSEISYKEVQNLFVKFNLILVLKSTPAWRNRIDKYVTVGHPEDTSLLFQVKSGKASVAHF
jgi:phosphatidylinositol glycan class B